MADGIGNSAGQVTLDIIGKVSVDQSTVQQAVSTVKQGMEAAANVRIGAGRGGMLSSGGSFGSWSMGDSVQFGPFAGATGHPVMRGFAGPNFGDGSAPFNSSMGVGPSGPMTSMGPVRTNFPGGAFFSNTVNPISGLMGVGPSGMQVHGSMFAPVQGAMQGPPTAQNYFAAMATQGAMQGPPTAANYFGAQATFGGMQGPPTGTDYYAGIAAARGEMQGPSREAWEEANFNRYLANNGPMQGPITRAQWMAQPEQVTERQRMYAGRQEGGQSRFSIGGYVALHGALGAVATGFRLYTSGRNFDSNMAMAGGNIDAEAEARVKNRQEELAAWGGIPFIGGAISSIRDYRDSGVGGSVADLQRTANLISGESDTFAAKNAAASSATMYRRTFASSYDALERERVQTDQAQRERNQEFGRLHDKSVEDERRRILTNADQFAREAPLDWSFSTMWKNIRTGKSYSQRMQDSALENSQNELTRIRNNGLPGEREAAQTYLANVQDIGLRMDERAYQASGHRREAGFSAGGDEIGAMREQRANERHQALFEARRAVDVAQTDMDQNQAGRGNPAAYAKTATARDRAQQLYDEANQTQNRLNQAMEREIRIRELTITNKAAEITVSGAAGIVAAGGQTHAAAQMVLGQQVQDAKSQAANRMATLLTSGHIPTDFATVMAGYGVSLSAQQAENTAYARNQRLQLLGLRGTSESLRYQQQGAEQFSNRQYGAARTSRFIAPIAQQVMEAEAAIEAHADNPAVQASMRRNMTNMLNLTEYQVQHHYDTGYAEQRDVYRTIKEGYTNPTGSLDISEIVKAINEFKAAITQGSGSPLFNVN